MENLGDAGLFGNNYRGKKVLITGHTGFKGCWLSLWLESIGAIVFGYALPPPTVPNHYDLLNLKHFSSTGDIRDSEHLENFFNEILPDIVFHLAAQPLVRYSYKYPVETFEINVIGTLKVFEAARKCGSVKAVVNITSDKCYENREWIWGYRENDPVGGYDPYSASKGCSELLTSSYRNSFFSPDQYKSSHNMLIASVRAGNVIGGGDWGEDRLVPDIMRAASRKEKVLIRSPKAIRPWQHVLEPLSAYLLLGQKLLAEKKEYAEAWNFGPDMSDHNSVETVVCELKKQWDRIEYYTAGNTKELHEANILRLDCSKAHSKLRWRPVWNCRQAYEKTGEWYREYYENQRILSYIQLDQYIKDAENKGIVWTE